MKGSLVNKKIISVISIIMLLLTTKVYGANDKFSTTLNADKLQVKREDTVTITIGLKDIAIESGEKGIAGYTGKLRIFCIFKFFFIDFLLFFLFLWNCPFWSSSRY